MDELVINFLNQWAGPPLDGIINHIASNPIFKGVPPAMIFLFLWFHPAPQLEERRRKLFALIPSAVIAIVVGRVAAMLLPFRERPLRNPELDLVIPESITPSILGGWSSFPSDHAVMFAALITGIWMVERWAGLLLVLHGLIVIAFARVFLTLHYPSDIIAGAVLGVAISLVLVPLIARLMKRWKLLELAERYPGLLHAVLFLCLFQIATMFESARWTAEALIELVGDPASIVLAARS